MTTNFKTKERAVAKTLAVIFQSFSALLVLTGFVFLMIFAVYTGTYTNPSGGYLYPTWVTIEIVVGCVGLVVGGGWAVLSAFTLKALYTSNNYKLMIVLASINAIFVITFPLTVMMIIIAKLECKK